jgi:hypothetical protein
MMKIANNAKGLQGVHTLNKGVVYLKPGQTRTDLEMDATAFARASALPFLIVEGEPVKTASADTPAAKPAKSPKATKASKPKAESKASDEPKSAAEVLAMTKAEPFQFLAFKAEAKKVLGDETPATKDEIVKALEELATKPA